MFGDRFFGVLLGLALAFGLLLALPEGFVLVGIIIAYPLLGILIVRKLVGTKSRGGEVKRGLGFKI